jgi:hypothetical protein
MIVQFRPDKAPAGLEARTRELGIKLINIQNNTVADLFQTLEQLGDALNEREIGRGSAPVEVAAGRRAISCRRAAPGPHPDHAK